MAIRIAVLGLIMAIAGCATVKDVNAVKFQAEKISQELTALKASFNSTIDTGGGDVNEPITGWILAAGYALIPLGFLIYMAAHRMPLFRSIKGRIRGDVVK